MFSMARFLWLGLDIPEFPELVGLVAAVGAICLRDSRSRIR